MATVISIRGLIRRRRAGLLGLAASGLVMLLVAWTHGGVVEDHMGETVAICLGVLGGSAMLLAGRRRRWGRGAIRRLARRAPAPLGMPLRLQPVWTRQSRAGPAGTQVFLR